MFINDKRKRFLLSSFTSPVLSIAPVFYHFNLVSPESVIYFFQASLISDLVLSYTEYPKCFWGLECFYHHTAYTFINVIALNNKEYLNVYIYYFIEEIPTAIRAIGYVFPQFRSDLLFGVCMISFRVVYHSLLLFVFNSFTVVNIFSSLALFLHTFWVVKWLKC